jgi:ubiquinol-cytochrome c reductase cytochrome c1 subunit
MRRLALSLTFVAALISGPVFAAGDADPLPSKGWSFDGLFGTFDKASAQRGFQVYKEVCAGCHGLALKSFRNLRDIGFTEDEVKAIAADYTVMDGPNDAGEMFERKGRPSDRFVKPFPNEKAARAANNGAYPPDLSLMVKARADGSNYMYALLTGYSDPPAGVTVPDGMYYNRYFPGRQIAMPAPISPDSVTFSDGTPGTVSQISADLTHFLSWVAEPELEKRKRLGIQVMLFLLVLTGMLYAVKRKVWADVH